MNREIGAGNKVKAGKSLLFWGLSEQYQAVAVVGLGKQKKDNDDIEILCEKKEAIRIAASVGCRTLDAVDVKDICVETLGDAEAAAEGCKLGTWKFQEYKSKPSVIPEVNLFEGQCDDSDKWDRGVIKADAQNIARRLADTPANLMTPTIFAGNVCQLFDKLANVSVKVHDKEWAEKEKMHAFLCVAQGSVEPPKFVEITYTNSDSKGNCPFVLVGKGVTFDAGGISLKPAAAMDEMRADMAGGACVVATLYALAKMCVETDVRVLVPMVENLPSGTAVKPGDVIRARNGKTICVDNTDAEGRLILADALSYSATYNPKWVLDVATLTGAMRVSLGDGATGVFSNSNELYSILEGVGGNTGDRVWRMPLWKHYTKQLTENAAFDLNNIGKGKGGGSCTAAAFLKEFIPEKTSWMHLDIAGVMGPQTDSPYLHKGMTGRPTRTLIEFVRAQSKCS